MNLVVVLGDDFFSLRGYLFFPLFFPFFLILKIIFLVVFRVNSFHVVNLIRSVDDSKILLITFKVGS